MKGNLFSRIILGLLLLTVLSSSAMKSSTGKTVYCYLIGDNSQTQVGISTFNLESPGTVTMLHPNSTSYTASAGVVVDGYMYCYIVDWVNPISFSKIDINTGAEEVIADYSSNTFMFADMTYDATTGKIYYISSTYNGKNQFGTVSLTDGTMTTISSGTSKALTTLACDKDGQLFTIAADRRLYKMDKTTAALTLVGDINDTDASMGIIQSMEFDNESGDLYWAGRMVSGCFLAKIDPLTGTTTKLGLLGNGSKITSLYIPSAPKDAPAAVSEMTLTPANNGVMQATISFKSPALTAGGDPLTSINSIKILRNGSLVKEFTNPTISTNYTYTDIVPTGGNYSYKIFATNSIDDGVSTTKSVFIGIDHPGMPTNVVLSKVDNNAILNWSAPTAGLNGGWFNPAELNYTITRLPDNIIFGNNVTGNTFTDATIAQLGNYSYKVQSNTATGAGGIGISNVITIGTSFQTPYSCSFDVQSKCDLWSIINANNDDKTWKFDLSSALAEYDYHSTNNADDWLISPPIAMSAGKSYLIKFDTKSASSNYPESLKVYSGQGITVESMNNLLADYPSLESEYITREITINPTVSGDYNFGFLVYSVADSYNLYLTNVVIEEVVFNNDLVAISIEGNAKPMQNIEQIYTIKVKNNGGSTQNDYKVQLIDEANNILSETGVKDPILANETRSIQVAWTPSTVGSISLKGKILLANDQNTSNNETKSMQVTVIPESNETWTYIGTGTNQDRLVPVSFFYPSSVAQTIYLKEEFDNGKIVSISYKYNNTSNRNLVNPIKIYMISTELSNLDISFIPQKEMILVFEGNVSIPKGEGELLIPLTTPFAHTCGNLCIMIEKELNDDVYDSVYFLTTKNLDSSRSRIFVSYVSPFDENQKGYGETIMANIGILSSTNEGGSLKGVVKSNGVAIADAKVSIPSLKASVTTDSNGAYEFGYLPAETHSIIVTKHGFETKNDISTHIAAGQTTTMNIDITALARFTVSGTVKDSDNNNVANASVKISGYDNYETTTSTDGTFSISDIYCNTGYTINVKKRGLSSHTGTFDLTNTDLTLPVIILAEIPNPPANLVATASTSSVNLTWEKPSDAVPFRYDDGVVSGQFGFLKGTDKAVTGAVHRTPSTLVNMSWYTIGTAEAGGPHSKVNIFIIDLDNEGNPTSTILFSRMNVPNTDDQWTTFRLPEPVDCPRGFMIAISYPGFVGIGFDSGNSEEYPFAVDGNYFSSDYTTGTYVKVSVENCGLANNLLIRAEGYESTRNAQTVSKSVAHSMPSTSSQLTTNHTTCTPRQVDNTTSSKALRGYQVWKLLEKDIDNEARWTLLTPSAITNTTFADNDWTTTTEGVYQYAVKAVYNDNVMSLPTLSNIVGKNMEVTVTLNVTTNTTDNESEGAIVKLSNKDNNPTHVYSSKVSENGKAVVDNVWKGMYDISITLNGFTTINDKNVEIKTNNLQLNYTLEEMIIEPYNLIIKSTEIPTERLFSWNNFSQIDDNFERHDDFTINSEGLGWSYIDGDNSDTYTLEVSPGVSAFFPGIGQPMAYMVFNPAQVTPPLTTNIWTPHSGDKYLVSFAALSKLNNDWIISPKLTSNQEMQIEFWAKSLSDKYDGLERFNVSYSTTGKSAADFTHQLTPGNYAEAPIEWTKFSYTLPAEAKYVAITCISNDKFAFMLDDISIKAKSDRAFEKYEVYLNDIKVSETTSTSYLFEELTKGKYIAGVRAIHTSMPSRISTIPFEVINVGIDSKDSAQTVSIYPNPATDILNIVGNYDKLDIYDQSGKLITSLCKVDKIDVSNFKNGIYILHIHSNNTTTTQKIIKH